jgi:hypothetical protein
VLHPAGAVLLRTVPFDDLLQETLDEEKAADEKLSSLAEGGQCQTQWIERPKLSSLGDCSVEPKR